MKLLIIEDEPSLLQAISRHLKREGYLCEEATDFQEAYRKMVNHEYDCVLLDLNLPKGDGMKLIRILKEQGATAGIIAFTVRDTFEERVSALNEGADDCLSKPFNLAELGARIKAVLRRKNGITSNVMDFGNLLIRLDEHSVEANGARLQLTRKEYNILVYLARNKNRVMTKDSIAEHLWGDNIDDALSYDFLYAHVKNLRRKLAENDCEECLQTVYGVGYKFIST
ncbi:MAG: response regulator transcription factor [Lewinellaceae bacterium]|nr:response regulator transcription factor [Lewinellaceae bacterium]